MRHFRWLWFHLNININLSSKGTRKWEKTTKCAKWNSNPRYQLFFSLGKADPTWLGILVKELRYRSNSSIESAEVDATNLAKISSAFSSLISFSHKNKFFNCAGLKSGNAIWLRSEQYWRNNRWSEGNGGRYWKAVLLKIREMRWCYR